MTRLYPMPLPPPVSPYLLGHHRGWQDRQLGLRSTVALTSPIPGYADGYADGWQGLTPTQPGLAPHILGEYSAPVEPLIPEAVPVPVPVPRRWGLTYGQTLLVLALVWGLYLAIGLLVQALQGLR